MIHIWYTFDSSVVCGIILSVLLGNSIRSFTLGMIKKMTACVLNKVDP